MKIILTGCFFCLLSMACVNNKIKNGKGSETVKQQIYGFGTPSPGGTGKFYLGREISQVMNSTGAEWLERNDREEEENVNLAIEKMGLHPTDVIADIGAGTGYYSFRMAKKVPQGSIYAVDVQDDFIEYLRRKKKDLNVQNVEVIKGSLSSPLLPDNAFDLVLMADVYHELEFPHEMLESISHSLKADGRLLLIEYKGEDASIPIKALHKTTVTQLNKEMQANGFEIAHNGEFLSVQHFLMYKKK